MPELRPLQETDLPVLGAIAQRAFIYDDVGEALVREKSVEARDWNSDLALAAEVEGHCAGFIIGCMGQPPREDRGWARLLAVDPRFARRGIGSALLEALERRLAGLGAQSIGVFDSTLYLTPGIDSRDTAAFCFLEKNGYEPARARKNLRCGLGPKPFDVAPAIRAFADQGIEIRRARPSDAQAVDGWLAEVFPGWRYESGECFRNDPITYFMALSQGRPIGFAAYHATNRTWPFFGPMGVDPAQRRAGLGKVLLYLCLNDLLDRGWDWAIIPWVGPVGFYNRACGATLDRVFWSFEKPLCGRRRAAKGSASGILAARPLS